MTPNFPTSLRFSSIHSSLSVDQFKNYIFDRFDFPYGLVQFGSIQTKESSTWEIIINLYESYAAKLLLLCNHSNLGPFCTAEVVNQTENTLKSGNRHKNSKISSLNGIESFKNTTKLKFSRQELSKIYSQKNNLSQKDKKYVLESLRTVAIFNIPLSICKSRFRQLVSTFGRIQAFTLKTMKGNKNLYAFVTFHSLIEAKHALVSESISVGDFKIFIKEYSSEKVVAKSPKNNHSFSSKADIRPNNYLNSPVRIQEQGLWNSQRSRARQENRRTKRTGIRQSSDREGAEVENYKYGRAIICKSNASSGLQKLIKQIRRDGELLYSLKNLRINSFLPIGLDIK